MAIFDENQYRAKLIPRPLAIWGLAGYAIILCGMLSEIMGSGLGLASSIPGGLWEVFMGVWLIAKGFSVQPDQIKLDEPIKKLDTMMVVIHLAEGLDTQVKVWVVPEKTAADLAAGQGKEPSHGADAGDSSSKSGEPTT